MFLSVPVSTIFMFAGSFIGGSGSFGGSGVSGSFGSSSVFSFPSSSFI